MRRFFCGPGEQATGFSLLEMMIAVAIVSILAAVAIPAYFNHTMRSRQTAAVGELMAIKGAQERHFAVTGAYAGNMNELKAGEGVAKYSVGGTYSNGDYRYWVTANSIMAEGDLNHDGNFNDRWQISLDDLSAQPQHDDSGTNEGFSWSSLGNLF